MCKSLVLVFEVNTIFKATKFGLMNNSCILVQLLNILYSNAIFYSSFSKINHSKTIYCFFVCNSDEMTTRPFGQPLCLGSDDEQPQENFYAIKGARRKK